MPEIATKMYNRKVNKQIVVTKRFPGSESHNGPNLRPLRASKPTYVHKDGHLKQHYLMQAPQSTSEKKD